MDNKLNYSSKRTAIYNAIKNTKQHPSARMVYESLKGEYPNLSLGTVYRNISLFKENGDVVSVASVNGEERIDADLTPHGHFICNCCGRVFDVFEEELTAVNTSLEEDGFDVEGCCVNFYGKCKKCSKGSKVSAD